MLESPMTPTERNSGRASSHATSGSDDSAWHRAAAHVVDAVGLKCPEPLMLVRNQVRTAASGEAIAVIATDPTTVRDFANFCRFMRHELTFSEQRGERFLFVIRKG